MCAIQKTGFGGREASQRRTKCALSSRTPVERKPKKICRRHKGGFVRCARKAKEKKRNITATRLKKSE